MKTLINIFLLISIAFVSKAQPYAYKMAELPIVYITDDLSVHFLSPEPVQYVDISTNNIVGDIPVENVVRMKYFPDTAQQEPVYAQDHQSAGVITIVGQSFIAQYNAIYLSNKSNSVLATSVEILPEHMKPLEFPEMSLSKAEMKNYSLEVLKRKRTYKNVASKENGMTAWLNNIYSFGDYVFVDVSFHNSTKIKYDIDQFRFKIEDKKIVKATNVQDVEIEPVFTLYNNPSFQRRYRNIFVFKKFTYPNNKVLNIHLTEEQISGRSIQLKIDYRDLLNADTL